MQGGYRGDCWSKESLGKDQAVCQAQGGFAKCRNDGVCNAVAQARFDEAPREPVGNGNQPPATRSELLTGDVGPATLSRHAVMPACTAHPPSVSIKSSFTDVSADGQQLSRDLVRDDTLTRVASSQDRKCRELVDGTPKFFWLTVL